MKRSAKLSLASIKRASVPVLKKAGVVEAAIFGSYARGEQRISSDVDVLIRTSKDFGLLELVALRDDLMDVLKKHVDVVSYRSVHPRMKAQVMSEAVRIL